MKAFYRPGKRETEGEGQEKGRGSQVCAVRWGQ